MPGGGRKGEDFDDVVVATAAAAVFEILADLCCGKSVGRAPFQADCI